MKFDRLHIFLFAVAAFLLAATVYFAGTHYPNPCHGCVCGCVDTSSCTCTNCNVGCGVLLP